MCKDNQFLKLCTCAPLTATVHNKNSRRAKRERAEALPIEDTTWHLQHFIENIESGMEGLPMMPVAALNKELTNTYVVSQLNAQNCFDFDYLPSQGDNLTLRNKGDFMSFISEIAKAAHSCASGTEIWYLIRYAKANGLAVSYSRVSELTEVQPPAILGTTLSSGVGHFVVLLGHDAGEFRIGDPLTGVKKYTAATFRQDYKLNQMVYSFRKKS